MLYSKELEHKKREVIKQTGKCKKCGSNFNLTIDHIIPIDILFLMGFTKEQTFDEDNFEVLCGKCNANKGNRLDFSNSKTRELLIKYMDLIK